jgi:CubicO group peptidase (beta-lactamase class C family)
MVCGVAAAGAQVPAPAHDPSFKAHAPRFVDPLRREKLARAFGDVDRLMEAFAAREHVPGAAWGIVIDGDLAHAGATGVRDVETRAPVTRDTVFRIASMTKSFTALAILALRNEGRLSVDDPADRFVPELADLVYPTSDSPRISIRHLLSHAEGFPEDNPWGDQQLAATDAEFDAMMRRGIPFSNPPGLAYEYSNYGFAILGRVVSRASGLPYRDYVATRILQPLGLSATTLEPSDVPADRVARGYRWEDERWKEEPQLADGAFGPMGGMLTSLADLSRYVALFLDAWPARDDPERGPVRRASLREMQQVWRSRAAVVGLGADGTLRLSAGGYGFGLGVTQTCTIGHVVAHSGGLPGFGSIMRWLPEHGVAVIALGNRTYTGWGGVVDEALARLAATGGLEPRQTEAAPALVAAKASVSRLVERWDDGLADELAAVNLFLDRSRDRRRGEIEALAARLGPCEPEEGFDFVENPLRGEWLLRCERGRLRASVTLAPTMPPRVQYLEMREEPAAGSRGRTPTCPPLTTGRP